jgi:transcriptional regulator with XRE-family HTH domain
MLYSEAVPVDPEKIKRLREKKGLTQDEAAAAAGMKSGRQHWNNIESGRQASKSISVELLERIAAALDTTASNLLK